MIKNCCAVILAAGEGKRFKSKKPKALGEVLFKPMVEWVIDAALVAGLESVCIVTGFGAEQIETHFNAKPEYSVHIKYALQREQLGTGHAVMAAGEFIRSHIGKDVLIMYGDAPFISKETIIEMYELHKKQNAACTLLSAVMDNPFGYGRILKQNGVFERIVEERDCNDLQKQIREVNAGMYLCDAKELLFSLEKLTPNNAQKEYYLTDMPFELAKSGKTVVTYKIKDNEETAAANDRIQLLELQQMALVKLLKRHMANGVAFIDTSGVVISPEVSIKRDTLILPGTVILGKTKIGEDCTVGPNAYIVSSEIGDSVTINSSQVFESKIGSNVKIGPFSYIRPGTNIGNNVKIGDFVEIKNSNIGDKTSVSHLTYIGDSDVGEHVNFGCGTVTCNYDGMKKHRTIIGDNAFLGCNTNLIAPVTVGAGAYTAAGSTITDDVPDEALAIARTRQTNKAGSAKGKIKK